MERGTGELEKIHRKDGELEKIHRKDGELVKIHRKDRRTGENTQKRLENWRKYTEKMEKMRSFGHTAHSSLQDTGPYAEASCCSQTSNYPRFTQAVNRHAYKIPSRDLILSHNKSSPHRAITKTLIIPSTSRSSK
jgi:hypothetical protein